MSNDDNFGCGPAIILAVICSLLAFGAGTCVSAASKATLADRCDRECGTSMNTDSWSDDTHICVCKNGHVAHIRTQATVLQQGHEDAGTPQIGDAK